jgi:hypothetical protein
MPSNGATSIMQAVTLIDIPDLMPMLFVNRSRYWEGEIDA